MIAFQTTVMTYKILKSRKPTYLSERIQEKNNSRTKNLIHPKQSLSIAKEGFINRGLTLMNMLDVSLRCEPRIDKFKSRLRKWVKRNIQVKPTPKFPALGRGGGRPPAPPAPPAPGLPTEPALNLITNYFQAQQRN